MFSSTFLAALGPAPALGPVDTGDTPLASLSVAPMVSLDPHEGATSFSPMVLATFGAASGPAFSTARGPVLASRSPPSTPVIAPVRTRVGHVHGAAAAAARRPW